MQPENLQLQQASSSAPSVTVSYFDDYHDELKDEFKRSVPWCFFRRERVFQHRKIAILFFLRMMLHQLETVHQRMLTSIRIPVGSLCLWFRRGMLVSSRRFVPMNPLSLTCRPYVILLGELVDAITSPVEFDIGADYDPYLWALSQKGLRRAKRAFTMAVLMRQALKMHRTIDVAPMSSPLKYDQHDPCPKSWEYRRLKTVERYASSRQMAEHGRVIIRMDAPVPGSAPTPGTGTPPTTKHSGGDEEWYTSIPLPPKSGYSPDNVDHCNRPISPPPSSLHLSHSSSNIQGHDEEGGCVQEDIIINNGEDANDGDTTDANYVDDNVYFESDDEDPLFSEPQNLAELAQVLLDPEVEAQVADMTDMRLENIRIAVWNHWKPYYRTQSRFYKRMITLIETMTSANVNQPVAQKEAASKRSLKAWLGLFPSTPKHTQNRDMEHEQKLILAERSRYLLEVPEH